MGQLIGAQAQVRSIAKAVATAFASTELTAEDLAPQQIVHTDLDWTVPPLITDLKLAGNSLQAFYDAPLAVTEDGLFQFWRSTLDVMATEPSALMHGGTMATARRTMPRVRLGGRAFRFATPLGHPARVDEMAGVNFSLEVAHAAYLSLPVVDLVSDDDNYFVETPDGKRFGVIDGRPGIESSWGAAPGMVQELLRMPRGETTHQCMFDQIAMVRSMLHTYRDAFKQFQAVDSALQALRYLSYGGYCPQLTLQMQVAPADVSAARARRQALVDAIEVMESNIPDRNKLKTLRLLLVPAAMTITAFRRTIFSSPDYPYTMELSKATAILTHLKEEYANCK